MLSIMTDYMSQSAGMPIALSCIQYDTDTQLKHCRPGCMPDSAHQVKYSATASLTHLFISVQFIS